MVRKCLSVSIFVLTLILAITPVFACTEENHNTQDPEDCCGTLQPHPQGGGWYTCIDTGCADFGAACDQSDPDSCCSPYDCGADSTCIENLEECLHSGTSCQTTGTHCCASEGLSCVEVNYSWGVCQADWSTADPNVDATCFHEGDSCSVEHNTCCVSEALECVGYYNDFGRCESYNADFRTILGVLRTIGMVLYPTALIIGFSMVIKAGYTFITSTGDPRKVKEAQEALTSALVGSVYVILSGVIIHIVLNLILGGI